MASTGSVSIGATLGGISISGMITETGETGVGKEISPGVGYAAVYTYSDSDTATLTFSGSNPLSDGDYVDIVWSGGRRYGMLTSGKSDLTIIVGAVGVGEGDNFSSTPATACVVCVQTSDAWVQNGDHVKMLLVCSDQDAQVTFRTSVPATILHLDLDAGVPSLWTNGSGLTNPLASSTTATIKVSSSTTTAATVKIGAIIDSVA